MRIRRVIGDLRPHVIFHAAAHKHVPLLERYPCEAVKTNVLGTQNLVDAAVIHDVERFILVSTDKAAFPTSILGASKRLAETIVHANALGPTKFASVRFGNVLGTAAVRSSTRLPGRWRPAFRSRSPTRRSHRFFMTIPEAVGLVIEAALMADHGETYVLDMGDPIRIVDVVERYAALTGLPQPLLEFIGLRSGEKLHEVLVAPSETLLTTRNPRISYVEPQPLPRSLDSRLRVLFTSAQQERDLAAIDGLRSLVAESSIGARPHAFVG